MTQICAALETESLFGLVYAAIHKKYGHFHNYFLKLFQVGYAVGGNSSNHFREPQSKELKDLADQELLKLEKTLEAFRKRQLNVLVATAVLEEGIDITQCNLVIHFDTIQTFRSYVQSKGRARAKPSQFIVMTEEGGPTSKWKTEQENYKRIGTSFFLTTK